MLLVALSTLVTGAHSGLTQVLLPANELGMARHSQAREMAADNGALEILHCHFGHVAGDDEFFTAVASEESGAAIGLSDYFASHPALQARIANLRRQAEQRGYTRGAVQVLNPALRVTSPLDADRHGTSELVRANPL